MIETKHLSASVIRVSTFLNGTHNITISTVVSFIN
nr:MAG TPA: hypothetical protein [Crassvirales sp.]